MQFLQLTQNLVDQTNQVPTSPSLPAKMPRRHTNSYALNVIKTKCLSFVIKLHEHEQI